jgi:hypothetical protein
MHFTIGVGDENEEKAAAAAKIEHRNPLTKRRKRQTSHETFRK